jgi:hypothetical protein
MKILIACEESQTVCKAFRAKGHEAYSCDIQPCSGGHPEWHIQGDAIKEAYSGKYDMMIAHPPCTYLSVAGAGHLYPKSILNQDRYKKGLEAKDFFMQLYNAPIAKTVVENPLPFKVFNLPEYTQTIHPYHFGEPFMKRTCLWIKGLPSLKHTNVVEGVPTSKAKWYNKGGKERQKNRSKFWQGIADAMADQWG